MMGSPSAEWRGPGNESTSLENADLVGTDMNVEDAASRRVRHAVEIAADAHHSFVRDPPFELEDRPIRGARERLQGRLFLGQGLVDDALRGLRARADWRPCRANAAIGR